MSTDQSTPIWGQTGAPTPPPSSKPKSSRLVTIVIAVVAAVVLVGGGIAVAKAVDSGSSTGTNQGGPGGSGPGGQAGGPARGQFGGRGDGLSGALHGDFVASDGNGGYVTKRLQSGTVTEVNSTSITAKSADGYTTTFVISSSTSVDNGVDTISDVKAGDTVTVVGTVAGSSATATSVFDATLNQANGNQMGGPANQNGTGS